MTKLTMMAFTIIGASGISATAAAVGTHNTNDDIHGAVCQPYAGSSKTSIGWDENGVRNDSGTTSAYNVICPMSLQTGTSRSLEIVGTDNNTVAGKDFSCQAFGVDFNLVPVVMPAFSIHTGSYTNGLITNSPLAIPDNVVRLSIKCSIPGLTSAGGFVSSIAEFFINYP